MSRRMYRVAALIPFLAVVVFLLTGGFYVNTSLFVGRLWIEGCYISFSTTTGASSRTKK
jgi:hypothetical protein